MTVILQIEHPVTDFASWKQAFDADPIGRRAMGVRRHRVMCPAAEPRVVAVELEFDDTASAEICLAALRELWKGVEGAVMRDPQVCIFDVVETQEY